MFKKTFMMVLFFCSFVFCGAMLNSGDHPSPEDEQELFNLFQTMHVMQYSCKHAEVSKYMVPRRFKEYSRKRLQNELRALLTKAEALGAIFTEEQWQNIYRKAYDSACTEIAMTF